VGQHYAFGGEFVPKRCPRGLWANCTEGKALPATVMDALDGTKDCRSSRLENVIVFHLVDDSIRNFSLSTP
jgi:hypothetical protein